MRSFIKKLFDDDQSTQAVKIYSYIVTCILLFVFLMAWILQAIISNSGMVNDWSGFKSVTIISPILLYILVLYFRYQNPNAFYPKLVFFIVGLFAFLISCLLNDFLPVSVYLAYALSVYLMLPVKLARAGVILMALSYVFANIDHIFHDEFWVYGRFILLGLVVCGVFDCWITYQFKLSDGVRKQLVHRFVYSILAYSSLMMILIFFEVTNGSLAFVVIFIGAALILLWFNRARFNLLSVIIYCVYININHILIANTDPFVGLAYSIMLVPLMLMWLPLNMAALMVLLTFAYDLYTFVPIASFQLEAFLGRIFFNYITIFFIFWSLLWALRQGQRKRVGDVSDLMPKPRWWRLFLRHYSVLILMLGFLISIPFIRLNQSGLQIITDMEVFITSSFAWLWVVLIIVSSIFFVMVYTNSIWAADRVADLYEKTKDAERLQTIFLSNMSHEMRTPLNGIIGMSKAAKLKNVGVKQQQQLEMIEFSGQRLKRLVDDTLDLIRIEKGNLQIISKRFSPYLEINDVIDSYRMTLKDDLSLTVDMKLSQALYLWGDAPRIQQVLDNLLHNAIKFTVKGSIDITCEYTHAELIMIVADTGLGMKPQVLEKIFEPYYQADMTATRAYQGVGIGLSVIKELVDRMGGKIIVESEFGKGSTFKVVIPLDVA